MNFDIIINKKFNNLVIDYGIIKGNNIIIFIKAGQNGSMYGYRNKYLNIAKNINNKYGYTVICSSNPFDGNNPMDNAMEVIEEYTKNNKISDYVIYYMGHSNGGIIGAWYGVKYPEIKRMLLINTPLMYNFYKTKEGIMNFNGESLVMVYGEFDQSYMYIELLNRLESDKFKVKIIKGQNHDFSNDITEFIELPDKYLINI